MCDSGDIAVLYFHSLCRQSCLKKRSFDEANSISYLFSFQAFMTTNSSKNILYDQIFKMFIAIGGYNSQWLTSELLTFFLTHTMRTLNHREEIELIEALVIFF